MIIPDGARLLLYMLMGILPVWADFFAKSTDYSLRGLAMPILASASSAVAICLAKTSARMDHPQQPMPVIPVEGHPLQVSAPPGKPVKTQEVQPKP